MPSGLKLAPLVAAILAFVAVVVVRSGEAESAGPSQGDPRPARTLAAAETTGRKGRPLVLADVPALPKPLKRPRPPRRRARPAAKPGARPGAGSGPAPRHLRPGARPGSRSRHRPRRPLRRPRRRPLRRPRPPRLRRPRPRPRRPRHLTTTAPVAASTMTAPGREHAARRVRAPASLRRTTGRAPPCCSPSPLCSMRAQGSPLGIAVTPDDDKAAAPRPRPPQIVTAGDDLRLILPDGWRPLDTPQQVPGVTQTDAAAARGPTPTSSSPSCRQSPQRCCRKSSSMPPA